MTTFFALAIYLCLLFCNFFVFVLATALFLGLGLVLTVLKYLARAGAWPFSGIRQDGGKDMDRMALKKMLEETTAEFLALPDQRHREIQNDPHCDGLFQIFQEMADLPVAGHVQHGEKKEAPHVGQ